LLVNNTNTPYKMYVTRTVGGVAVFLSLIPWFSFGLLGGDSMPWPFMGYLLFFLSFKVPTIIVPKNFIVFFVVLVCGLFIALFMSNNIIHENTFRSLYNYLGVVVFYLGFFNYLIKYGFPMHIFIAVNIIWLLFAVLEVYFPNIASIFSSSRTGDGRGVTSLAPEPTFFGMYLFFSSWLMLVASNYKPGKYLMYLIFFNLIFIVLVAKSSMMIIYLMFSAIIFLAYTFIKLKWKKKLIKNTIILGAFLFIGGSIINNSLGGSRYLSLLKKLLNEVSLSDLFFLDGSLNQRLEHLVYSMHGAVNNFFIPAGFDAFVHIKDKLDSTYNYYFWSSGLYGEPSNKIMSWSGD